MGRHSCCQKQKLKKGLWSPEEDEKLVHYITKYGHGCWSTVPKQAGLQRCGKSCRLRWINYLRPDLKRGIFSADEEKLIIDLHKALGNRWSQIATHLPGRTDNEIKNYWNTCIKKKLRQAGIDPTTHSPMSDNPETSISSTNPTNIHQQQQQQQQNQGTGHGPAAMSGSEDLSEPPSKRPKMYPAVLEDILFAPRQVLSLDKKGEDLSKTSEQQQQQQHIQQLTTDNFLGKFLASAATPVPVESKIVTHQSHHHGSSAESPVPGFNFKQQQQQLTTDNLLEKFIASPRPRGELALAPRHLMQNFHHLQVQAKPEFSFPVAAAAAAYTSPILWVLHGGHGGGSPTSVNCNPASANLSPSPASTSTSTALMHMEAPFGSLADLSSLYADHMHCSEVPATAGMVMNVNPVQARMMSTSSSSTSSHSHGQQQQQQQQHQHQHQHHHITSSSLDNVSRTAAGAGGWENLCSTTTTSSTTTSSTTAHHNHHHHHHHQVVTQTLPTTSVAPSGSTSLRSSSLLHWNYSHKLESSDGSCESQDQLPMHEVDYSRSDNQQQHHYQQHHHQHHHKCHQQQHVNMTTSEPISSSSGWPASAAAAPVPPLMTGVDLSSATSFGPMSPELQRLAAVIDQM